MKSKRIRTIIVFFLFFATLISILFVYQQQNKAVPAANLADKETKTIKPNKIVYFEEFGEENFTCTGLTYDIKDNSFWIADYGALKPNEISSPRLIEVNKDLDFVIDIISLQELVNSDSNIQGICYDSSNDSLWVATGSLVINVNKAGKVINTINLGDYAENKSNGVAYERSSDTIWVLCHDKYLLKFNKSGNVLYTYEVNIQDQDQICLVAEDEIIATVGADYNGCNNFVVKIDIKTEKIAVVYSVVNSYAVEGICMVDGKLYIVNDGLYHDAKIKKSFLSIYDVSIL